jgi:hypothetical protein
MRISACQPYFAPFSGFFQKALLSDVLVLMDRVQFPRGATWLTRNRFKNEQGTLWMTIPVWKKGLGLQRIDEVRICHERGWARKHLASLQAAYGKAPFFEDHEGFLKEIFLAEFERLVDLNVKIIPYLMGALGIPTKVVRLSDLSAAGREPHLSVSICLELGGTEFLAQTSARKFLDEKAFGDQGIDLVFFNPKPPIYPQLWGPFLANLSALDLLFNCGPSALRIMTRPLDSRLLPPPSEP